MSPRIPRPALAPSLVVALALAGQALGQASFTPLGFRNPAVPYSEGWGLSASGQVAVGFSLLSGGIAGQSGAYRWTAQSGMVPAFDIAAASSVANGATPDGSLIVGSASFGDFSPLGRQVFLFNSENGAQLLGDFPSNPNGVPRSFGRAISANGDAVVGYGLSSHGTEAFLYRVSTGQFTGLGALASGANFTSWAYGVNADGSVVVGATYSAPTQTQAFRWTSVSGMAPIPFLATPAGTTRYSIAEAVKRNGNVVIGESRSTASGNGLEAFRWTAKGGIVGLGDLPGGDFQSWAYAMTPDGGTIVGRATIEGNSGPFGGGSAPHPFIWDAAHGMRDLHQMLADAGVLPAGWTLHEARGVSADGLTITGTGQDPQGQTQAWIATLPPPPPCYPNCDNSTTPPILNVNDFGCFLNRFAAGDSYANCDGSTTPPVLNVLDFGCFLNRFATGCP